MNASRSMMTRLAAFCFFGLVAASAVSAQPAPAYEPKVGQQGKDVVWVPTNQELVEKMLDAAKVTAADYVIDLGSGDGRTVIAAAKRGARAKGIEYEPEMVELAKRNAAEAGVAGRVEFVKADLFESDFSAATVITMFLLPDINLRLRPRLLELRPGTRLVSNTFTMGEWNADQTVEIASGCASFCKAYLWIVPAKVEGNWLLPQGELSLKQTFQTLSGTLKAGNVITPVTEGKVSADQLTFTAGGTTFSGRLNGNVLEGTSRNGATESSWRGTRF